MSRVALEGCHGSVEPMSSHRHKLEPTHNGTSQQGALQMKYTRPSLICTQGTLSSEGSRRWSVEIPRTSHPQRSCCPTHSTPSQLQTAAHKGEGSSRKESTPRARHCSTHVLAACAAAEQGTGSRRSTGAAHQIPAAEEPPPLQQNTKTAAAEAAAAAAAARWSLPVQERCDLLHREQHDAVGRHRADDAGGEALVEALDAALLP